jgi:exo-beta-1,3-glucanase (GH17 family)
LQIELLGRLLSDYPSCNLGGIAVGSEAISRGDVKEQQLLQYIAQVQPEPHSHSNVHADNVTPLSVEAADVLVK